VFTGVAHASTNDVAPFVEGTLEQWQERSFAGRSKYELAEDDGIRVLRGSTDGQASMLYKKLNISLTQTPNLSWHWKVNRTFGDIDEQTLMGDDFPARIYVAYRYGKFPWQIYAINYVWASHSPVGSSWTSPYTKKSKIIAIQSGKTLAGHWQHETRNVAEDFASLFNVEIKALEGLAVMVDGDNTGMSAVAHFGAIQFNPDQQTNREQ